MKRLEKISVLTAKLKKAVAEEGIGGLAGRTKGYLARAKKEKEFKAAQKGIKMTKIEFIRGEMMAAMKARDKKRKDVLSMLLTALKNKAIDKREDLTTEEEDQIILKQIKQTKETLEMTPADRTDIIEECEYTIKVLEEYAPKMMSEDEITAVIKEVLSGLAIETPTAKDKGKIMKELMPRVKGKADGKVVNQVLASMME